MKIKRFNEDLGFDEEHANFDYSKWFVKEEIFSIGDYHFDELVTKLYGKQYEINAEEQHLYESSLEFNIAKNKYDTESNIKGVRDWANGVGKYPPGAYTLLGAMCGSGLIPEGKYIISYGG